MVEGVGWGIYQPDGMANPGTLQLPEVAPTINWVRLPLRFPVRIDLPDEDPAHPFRIGQTAVVEINTLAGGSEPVGSIHPEPTATPASGEVR